MLDKFSEDLRKARMNAGISIEQISSKTRIDLRFVEAIDNGNYSFLPELYVRAFIKEYANMVGLDPEITLTRFELAKEGKSFEDSEKEINTEHQNSSEVREQADESKVTSETDVLKAASQNGKSPLHYSRPIQSYDDRTGKSSREAINFYKKNLWFWVVSVVIIAAAFFVIFFVLPDKSKIIVPEKSYEDVLADSKQRFVEEQKTEELTESGISLSSDSIYLTLISSGTSWIQVIKDDKQIEEFTLSANSSKTVKAANKFQLIIGNSGSVSIKMNNQPIEFQGTAGAVRYVAVDQNGLQYLNSRPSLTNSPPQN